MVLRWVFPVSEGIINLRPLTKPEEETNNLARVDEECPVV